MAANRLEQLRLLAPIFAIFPLALALTTAFSTTARCLAKTRVLRLILNRQRTRLIGPLQPCLYALSTEPRLQSLDRNRATPIQASGHENFTQAHGQPCRFVTGRSKASRL